MRPSSPIPTSQLASIPQGDESVANRGGQRSSNDLAKRLQLPPPLTTRSYPFQYVLLMSEAIVVLAGESILTNSLTHRAKKHLHWILQILGVIFTIAGVVLMYRVKTMHFLSIHAILGITSVCIMIFLTIFGYPVYIAAKLRKVIRPVVIKFGHNFLGTSCFAIGMASQCYGYKKFRALNLSPDVDVRMICIIITAIITILSVRKSLPSLFRQLVTLFR